MLSIGLKEIRSLYQIKLLMFLNFIDLNIRKIKLFFQCNKSIVIEQVGVSLTNTGSDLSCPFINFYDLLRFQFKSIEL